MKNNAVKNGKILNMALYSTAESKRNRLLFDAKTWCALPLLVFAVAMSNVAFGEKIYSEHSVKKDYPYDVMSMFDLPEEQGVSMKDGREIIEQ